jgi:hypothetical protein
MRQGVAELGDAVPQPPLREHACYRHIGLRRSLGGDFHDDGFLRDELIRLRVTPWSRA